MKVDQNGPDKGTAQARSGDAGGDGAQQESADAQPSRLARYRDLARAYGLAAVFKQLAASAARVAYASLERVPALKKVVKTVLPQGATKKIIEFLTRRSTPKPDRRIMKALAGAARQGVVIVCNAYPGGEKRYGGEFIRTRAEAYARSGNTVHVLELSVLNRKAALDPSASGAVKVIRFPAAHVDQAIALLAKGEAKLAVHSPAPKLQETLQKHVANERLVYWFHGFEVRDYRRLSFNYTTEEMAPLRDGLDEHNVQRMEAARACFQNEKIAKVFVSNYIRTIAERDAGAGVSNAHIIPNFIDCDRFAWRQKTEEHASRFLLIRSFSRRNYANDIAIEAVKLLSGREGFDALRFTIRGFGEYFAPLARRLEGLPNVDMVEEYLNPDQMAALHQDHGVFLCPSRFDTQGVTMGEAMASGLVCITNRVTAIPEYIDEKCGVLVREDDPAAYADAIWRIKENPDMVAPMSKAAGERVRAQCGIDQTVSKEIALMREGSDVE